MSKKKIKQKIKITPMAATNVKINETITMHVAIKRFSANIFFNCFIGPIRKHVLNWLIDGKENKKNFMIKMTKFIVIKGISVLLSTNWTLINLIDLIT